MPSMVPTEYAITTQTFTATFKTLVYADLARNESLYSLFITEYATAVSRSAEVPVSQVRVIELYEGSVVVKAQLNYTALDVLSGADPAKFAAIIEDNTGKGISSVISSSSFLVVYIGNVTVTENVTITRISPSVATTAPPPSVTTRPIESPQSPPSMEDSGHRNNASETYNASTLTPSWVECPVGFVDDGGACRENPCVTQMPCDPLVECIPRLLQSGLVAAYTCEACPSGYTGDGAICEDIDECADETHGGCDPSVECINTAGGWQCAPCAPHLRGSGYTRCLPRTVCALDNGGCDPLTQCFQHANSSVTCGECPVGYVGSGDTGCVDEDGCAASSTANGNPPQCYTECRDVPANGTGYTCAACPLDMVGDGKHCVANLCLSGNGGCDFSVPCIMDADTGNRTCGECPAGYAPQPTGELSSGWMCADIDGCIEKPCWSSGELRQHCEDVPAPGSGRVCGECPVGYVSLEDTVSGDLVCVDVDECQQLGNVACWVSEIDIAGQRWLQRHSNAPVGQLQRDSAGHGYFGAGETGCSPVNESTEGDEQQVVTDPCASGPCFPGVVCTEVPAAQRAPGAANHICGECPEGYRGNGTWCEVCELLLSLDHQMGTVINGEMKRQYVNQLTGVFHGLSDPTCVLTQGVEYMWEGTSSDGKVLALDNDINKHDSLQLYLPRHFLTANVMYHVRLRAALCGNRRVFAKAYTSFAVPSQPLVALINGGNVRTAEGSPIRLDAGASVDPDEAPGEIYYKWKCVRTDRAALDANVSGLGDRGDAGEYTVNWEVPRTDQEAKGMHCRTIGGNLLPVVMHQAVLTIMLQGAQWGAHYALACEISKGDRRSTASTWVTIFLGSAPVPALQPLPGKHTPSTKLILMSDAESLRSDTLEFRWSAENVTGAGSGFPLDLASATSNSVYVPELVLRPNTLTPGSTYRFMLTARDSHGVSSAVLDVRVNSPPHSGELLPVTPLEGYLLDTVFDFQGIGWEDDDDDKPLWYQVRYEVVVPEWTTNLDQHRFMLSQWQVSPKFQERLCAAGLEETEYRVTVFLYVKDSLGATAAGEAKQNISVRPQTFENESELDSAVNDLLHDAARSVAEGTDLSNQVVGIAAMLQESATQQNLSAYSNGAPSPARLGQREKMAQIVDGSWANLPPTTDTVTRLAEAVAVVASAPLQLTEEARGRLRNTAKSLTGATRGSNADSQLDLGGARALVTALSDTVTGALGNRSSNQSAEVATAVETVRDMGHASAAWLRLGEEPVIVEAELLSYAVQRDNLSATCARTYATPLTDAKGSSVLLPPSVGAALGSVASDVTFMLVGSTVDQHHSESWVPKATTASPGRLVVQHRNSNGDPLEADVWTVVSRVTDISLYVADHPQHALAISGLPEAITLTLPVLPQHFSLLNSSTYVGNTDVGIRRQASHTAQCTFWNAVTGRYSSEGCATLPNPTPLGAPAFWENVSETVNGASAALDTQWTLGAAPIASGCTVTWKGMSPEFGGAGAGMRQYVGEGCQLADPSNEAGCWWNWQRQAFEGSGCVWAMEVECLCTHLTEFTVMAIGNLEPPEKISIYGEEDLAALSAADVVESQVLIMALMVLMVGAPLLFMFSNAMHNRARLQLARALLDPKMRTFCEIDGVWTWSIRKFNGNRLSFAAEAMHMVSGIRLAKRLGAAHTMPQTSESPNDEHQDFSELPLRVQEEEDKQEESEDTFDKTVVLHSDPGLVSARICPPNNVPVLDVRACNGDRPEEPGHCDPKKRCLSARPIDRIRHNSLLLPPSYKQHGRHASVIRALELLGAEKRRASAAVLESYQPAVQQPTSGSVNVIDDAKMWDAMVPDILAPHSPHEHSDQIPSSSLIHAIFRASSISKIRCSIAGIVRQSQSAWQRWSLYGLEVAHILRQSLFAVCGLRRSSLFVKRRALAASEEEVAIHLGSQALFCLLGIDLYRLHLSIPLEYLAVKAKLRMSAKRARSKRKKLTSRPELYSGNNRPFSSVDSMINSNVNAMVPSKPVSQPNQPLTESTEPRENRAGALWRSGVSNVIDLATAVTSLCVSTRGVGMTVMGLPKASTPSQPMEKPKELWHRLRLRLTKLPTDRMMGTAIVQAYLAVHSVLSKDILQQQMELADPMPWQLPNERRFSWYVDILKALIEGVSKRGWYARSRLWNLIFLQRIDGAFELTDPLATVLMAGVPKVPLHRSPIPRFDTVELKRSVPPQFLELQGTLDIDTLYTLWASMLAQQALTRSPHQWRYNPWEYHEGQQRTAENSVEYFILGCCTAEPAISSRRSELVAIASAVVREWEGEWVPWTLGLDRTQA
ncbi:hypothetical protein CYMTET_19114 [Cymbomonas tetramitiformis]|uniref:GPS domain-containing protein n=1 Tax=Cymbomonas tetramitiformis TaxID=36881 RepID=A0AAE0G755_9CHLO|nr:hypothetical protein CYMTET_19114 [Cymbomonas tetramitiformis]